MSTACTSAGTASQLCRSPAKGQLPPAQEREQRSRRKREPLSLGRSGLSPHSLQSKIKSCWHNFCQHNPRGFSWDAQGRHGFPTHGCTCISHPLLVNRSQSLSIEAQVPPLAQNTQERGSRAKLAVPKEKQLTASLRSDCP